MLRECLECGMPDDGHNKYCLKCDAELQTQTDGSVLTIDIAHHGERIPEALVKLQSVISEAKAGYTGTIRLIVGRGLIRDEVIAHLESWQRSRKISAFGLDHGNDGVLSVTIRSTKRRYSK